MGIFVKCPNGHHFKVKDKYSGKKGLCPHCEGQVVVQVPDLLNSQAASDVYRKVIIEENRAKHAAPSTSSSSIFDDMPADRSASTSGSLLGSSVIRHNIKCKCGNAVPHWYAKCPACGTFIDHR